MQRMIGKVYKSKKACDIVRNIADIKVAIAKSNHVESLTFSVIWITPAVTFGIGVKEWHKFKK